MMVLNKELKGLRGRERKTPLEKKANSRKQALQYLQKEWAKEDYRRTVSAASFIKDEQAKAEIGNNFSAAGKEFDALRPFMPERSRLADIGD